MGNMRTENKGRGLGNGIATLLLLSHQIRKKRMGNRKRKNRLVPHGG